MPETPKTSVQKVFGFLSNGFILLLFGSLITSFIVPGFQRGYERRVQRSTLMQDCLTQFLLYSNSTWQEYYSILPLTLQPEISKDEYLQHINEISSIKLKRFDAYARVQALALVFREPKAKERSPVETALNDYAKSVNAVSEAIDTWLRNLYCTPTKREKSPCATFDPAFDAYDQYLKIHQLVLHVGNDNAQQVAELIVEGIKSPQ